MIQPADYIRIKLCSNKIHRINILHKKSHLMSADVRFSNIRHV
jgi:hypothetical protein